MAVALRQPPKDCIHHTDRGSQYCSHDYQKWLKKYDFNVSMSGKENCYDNAAVETFFKLSRLNLSGATPGKHEERSKWPCLNISTDSIIYDAGIQR